MLFLPHSELVVHVIMLLGCCTEKHCGENEFRCLKVFQCIDNNMLYDGHSDCIDGTDETGQGSYICCRSTLQCFPVKNKTFVFDHSFDKCRYILKCFH